MNITFINDKKCTFLRLVYLIEVTGHSTGLLQVIEELLVVNQYFVLLFLKDASKPSHFDRRLVLCGCTFLYRAGR